MFSIFIYIGFVWHILFMSIYNVLFVVNWVYKTKQKSSYIIFRFDFAQNKISFLHLLKELLAGLLLKEWTAKWQCYQMRPPVSANGTRSVWGLLICSANNLHWIQDLRVEHRRCRAYERASSQNAVVLDGRVTLALFPGLFHVFVMFFSLALAFCTTARISHD